MQQSRSRRLRSATQPVQDNIIRMTAINDNQLRQANTWLQSYLKEDQDLVIVKQQGILHEFMKSHKTQIPLGENCQAQLPVYLGYRGLTNAKAEQNRKTLSYLMLSSRTEDEESYKKQWGTFQEVMGVDRNEEEMALSLRLYRESQQRGSFQEYLVASASWLDDYLDLVMHKPAFLKKRGRKRQGNPSGQKGLNRL